MTGSQGPGGMLARADVLLDRVLYYLSSLLLIAIATAVMYTVIARYVFNAAPLLLRQANGFVAHS